MSHSPISRIVFLGALLFITGSVLFGSAPAVRAASLPITGYAWSDYLGWVHFNGSNYGVYEDSSTGALSGYAWSPYFGWVSFNQAQVNLSNGAVTGWAQSCAAFADKNACNGALDPGSGGWDGLIHLSGSGYGITSTAGCWTGYAYGSQDIGFIKFAGTAGDGYSYKVGDSSCGAPTATLTASPTSVDYGGRSTLTWSSTNATSCTAGGPWSTSGNTSGSGLTDPLTSDTTFTLQCTGSGGTASAIQSVTVTAAAHCPNGDAYISSSCVACSNGGCTGTGGNASNPFGSLVCNNGANNPPTCTSFVPAATLSANPSTIDSGQSTTLTWSSTHATSCTAAGGFSTGGATSGSASSGALTQNPSIFQITCSSSDGTSPSASASVAVLSPDASISANPTRVLAGETSTISWSASDVTSCAVSGPGLSSASKTGSQSVTINSQSTYTITCQTNGSPIIQSVTVNIGPAFQEF